MTQYRYDAIGKTGKRISGEIDAPNREAVLDQINEQGFFPIDVTRIHKTGHSSRSTIDLVFGNRPSKPQITIFTRELAMLLGAGLTLERSLAQLEHNNMASSLGPVILKLRTSIDDGKPFHMGLAEVTNVFPKIYIALIRVAEATGTLAPVLTRIAETREKEQKLGANILSVVLYPILLILTAIGAICLIMMFVVPKFKEMLSGANLPVSSSIHGLMAASDWLETNGGLLLISLLIIPFLAKLALRHQVLKSVFNDVLIKLPLIGNLYRLHLSVNFCRTMGILLENGVDLHTALSLTRDAVADGHAATTINEACDALRKGQSFVDPLARSPYFHPLIVSMFKVGEETDNLHTSAQYLAAIFRRQTRPCYKTPVYHN